MSDALPANARPLDSSGTVPIATCSGCGKRVRCLVHDGYTWRPSWWTWDDSTTLTGLCTGCASPIQPPDESGWGWG